MTSVDEPRLIRPLIVVRSRRTITREKELVQSPQFIHQYTAIRAYADESGGTLERPIVIQRSDARFFPADDLYLKSAIEDARENSETLAIDDVFRLVDCRKANRANAGFNGLIGLRPPIYSILHGMYLMKMPIRFAQRQTEDRLRQSLIRSQRIKDGIEKFKVPSVGPTKKAIEKAASSKKRKADTRAARSIIEIERVRATLSEGRRTDLKAIAAALNEASVSTPSGRGRWQGPMVRRVFDRLGKTLDD